MNLKFSIVLFVSLLPCLLLHGELVEIQRINPSIAVDLFLAKPNNAFGQALYPASAKAYLLKEVALVLDLIQKELNKQGLGLKIMDALRPTWAQKLLWDAVCRLNIPNPGNYVSDPNDPNEGGRHPRGTAVDLRLINISDGSELIMPPFGITEKAHQGYIGDLSEEQIKNRELLKEIMMRYGFTPITCEWWHYDFPNWRKYPTINKTFEELAEEIN